MKSLAVAKRYASALFELAREKGAIDSISHDFEVLEKAIQETPDVKKVLDNPVLIPAAKKELLEKLFPDFNPITKSFLKLLVDKRREVYLPEIIALFAEKLREERGEMLVEVESARELKGDLSDLIKEKLSRLTGKKVTMKVRTNPDLIGGIVVRVGNKVYDGSIKNQLYRLKRSIYG
ncbi:ATP synthase F1 subunit delta [Carboxydothermus hydrogenoformans]|uniref:ATP synthase subunit delta n=1 Tax=Carboxydothermus hydrogenoformans (strain ATCC BAA-161 / DSM 6008 / Z-2901) TaxID=246194 RepID=ATPD_CARHZ|nr:ATP synthase F1 subunit delta [Carboxydothermus hydrogenoformans]Q3A943.1 RecName: Full=ATP synthase subunit delta; AltName: Full=ATP synthase F(1) sector subunit delta; AltName: Full=F-type ATPase subunit delta; Short=F-ATPase subunit delta [Carboxydothermus hydrogenoformans Z-2901]ABB14418.1 ATP synthase F1, delta subunit [Carboxydothermus hydrogenoformans Z-2901]